MNWCSLDENIPFYSRITLPNNAEDNYNVNWIQMELYYICDSVDSPNNFNASDNINLL